MSKRLVVCCDGTWDKADQAHRTNVTKVSLAVRPQDSAGKQQRVYYHRGVGTHRWDRWRGGAFGAGLAANVFDAYRFLVDNYEPSDELYLFGFSRGAYTARSVAGLVRNCGILRREDADRLKEAWALYRDRVEEPTGVAATLFRRAYAHEPRIRFIGVWDTVGSLGIPWLGINAMNPLLRLLNKASEFNDTKLSSHVDGAFQALAVDEQRPPFRPTLWEKQPWAPEDQELQQVWFSGVHSDVGGGYPDTSLSDVALLWMVRQAERYGLEFDRALLADRAPERMDPAHSVDFHVHADPLGTLHDSRTGLYRLLPAYHRPIGHGGPDGFEALASSAALRYERDAGYRPVELVAYLSDPDQVRVETV